jgi:DNA polymerase-1
VKYFVIDGNSIMNRAYYGVRLLSNKKGIYTNAIFGFMNIYLKNIKEIQPDAVITAFDLREPTFRHKADSAYKANRHGMPDELAMQMPYIKQILDYMGVTVIECAGYEADDIIGTIADTCSKNNQQCHVLTGDRDSLQLIDENVTVHLVTNKETIWYTPEYFIDEYKFEPINLIDLKALMGDSSDNISGVKGIGEKTAKKLIEQWHTIENLYENIENADLKPAMMTKLKNGVEDAKKSKWLATIVKDAPIEKNLEVFLEKEKDENALSGLLVELEMVQLIDRLKLGNSAAKYISENQNTEKSEISDNSDNSENPENNYKNAELKIPSDLTKHALHSQIIENFEKSGKIIYYLFDENEILTVYDDEKLYFSDDKNTILAFFESECQKATFKAKPHYRFAMKNDKNIKNIVFDAEIGAYLIDSVMSEYVIDTLSQSRGISLEKLQNMEENVRNIILLSVLCKKLSVEIEEMQMTSLMNEIELPLTEVLASMEHYGVKVDVDGVKSFGEYLKSEIEETQQMIWQYAGREFNISSPKQLGVVLFEEMGLPVKKKTKTGYSTNADVLNELRSESPIIDLILKYRQYTKLDSTYVTGLLKEVEEDGRIHTCYKQTETRTGRISSTEPNLQNIPVRTELGKNMRKFFIAKDGYDFVDADYSQIELRVLANLCEDENMQETFLSGLDIHTKTAAEVMGLPEEFVTPSMRSAAKAINFGIIYGMGAYSLSKDIDVSVKEAKLYISNYLKHYPRVTEYMDKTVEEAKKTGNVRTYFGRIRPIPELAAKNKMMQALGKRVAMNTPIQGTAADIIKKAMICVYKRLKNEIPQARLILQIHDELIVETPCEYTEKAMKIVQEEMENVCKMRVPLTADAHSGKSWYDAKD